MANDCHWAGPLGVEDVVLGFMQQWPEPWNQLVVTLSRMPAPNLAETYPGCSRAPIPNLPTQEEVITAWE